MSTDAKPPLAGAPGSALLPMKFHAFYCNWLWGINKEAIFLLGFATGRVSYEPEAQWLYSLRVFLGVFKVEILWCAGAPNAHRERPAGKENAE